MDVVVVPPPSGDGIAEPLSYTNRRAHCNTTSRGLSLWSCLPELILHSPSLSPSFFVSLTFSSVGLFTGKEFMFSLPKAATATGFGGFPAQPTAPSTTQGPAGGGLGFPSTNTSTNTTTLGTSAWAAPAAANAWSAKPAATGYSWSSAQPQQQQQQPGTMGGWANQPSTLGAPSGWGPQPQPQQAPQPQSNYVTLQDFARQSALASFLMELDKAYDALGPKCRFRTFVYNVCPPGQATDAVQRERYIAFLNGGGVPEEDWMAALQHRPDPLRTYPQPLHFAQELRQRCDKQKAELKRLTDLVDGYLQDVETVAALDEANKNRLKVLRQEDSMLRRRWYLLQLKLEVLSRLGQSSGDESLLLRQVDQLRQTLAAPGMFRDALESLQPLLDSEAEACAEQQSASMTAARRSTGGSKSYDEVGSSGCGLLRSHVDSTVMDGWVRYAKQMQGGIQALHSLLERDSKDMAAIRERVAS